SPRETCGTLGLYSQTLAAYTDVQQKLLEAAAMILATALAPKSIRAEVEYAPEVRTQDTPLAPVFNDRTSNLLVTTIESDLTH
ncbi:MAG TPA: hypothetical protein VE821_08515, partial [Pyrinomonadaceae bacterium]|nr:hypothetical protein [Pyrinomonadaceae bacterium]